jgi:integrase
VVRLRKTCEGRDFTSRRDSALILLLVDTGMRRAECAGMTLEDVDLDQRIVWVLGKGRRPRALPIGRKDSARSRPKPAIPPPTTSSRLVSTCLRGSMSASASAGRVAKQ